MIKYLVFDLDNTLIDWKDEYIYTFYNALKKLNLNYDDETVIKMYNMVDVYEDTYPMYDKGHLVKFLNEVCNINLPEEFEDILVDECRNCFVYSEDLVDTIEYLSTKYELICLTNWFTKSQIGRLKGAGIYKYFKNVTGGDEHIFKPSSEAFNILDNKSECIMIGDSLNKDIYPAIKLGMKAILITQKDIKEDGFKIIRNITELKEML